MTAIAAYVLGVTSGLFLACFLAGIVTNDHTTNN